MKPTDKASLGEVASVRAVTQVNAQVASSVYPEGRVLIRGTKAAWAVEI